MNLADESDRSDRLEPPGVSPADRPERLDSFWFDWDERFINQITGRLGVPKKMLSGD